MGPEQETAPPLARRVGVNRTRAFLPSEAQLDQIFAKRTLLREFSESGMSQEEFAKARGICRTTLWSYSKKSASSAYDLVDQRGLYSGRKVEIDAPVAAWILEQITAHPKIKIQALHNDLVKEEAPARGWKVLPSYEKVLRFAKSMSPELAAGLKRGPRTHFEKFGQVCAQRTADVNELWQLDCTEIPVYCLDIKTGKLFRPWMTSFIDTASRVVLCCHLTEGHPNSRDVLCALRTAMLPKGNDTCPFYGKPVVIQSDNHNVFKGEFLEALLELEIEPLNSPNRCPSNNGKIERMFRTFADQLFSGLNGYTKQFQGLDRAKANPIPYPLLARLIERYLIEYHTQTHRTLKRSPWEAWHEGLVYARGLVFSEEALLDGLQVRENRVVHRKGVEATPGCFYNSVDLAPFTGETVTVKMPPDGPGNKLRAYFKGKLVAELRPETDATLANEIAGARVSRSIDLKALRQTLLEIADGDSKPLAQSPGSGGTGMEQTPEEDLSEVPTLQTEDLA
jgi:transposase InsO family protein